MGNSHEDAEETGRICGKVLLKIINYFKNLNIKNEQN
tara:strand:- start:325 stop:435 length:111 start_codon:yes stop_codon:yes gene_type:complete